MTVLYSLYNYDFNTVDRVRADEKSGVSFKAVRDYFYMKGWRGRYILKNHDTGKTIKVRL
jgi:hypothetical protein